LQAGRIVVQSVNDDSAIKEFARKQLNAHWNEMKLVYANVGIKIARVVYALMVKGTEYDPKYQDPTKKTTPLLETTPSMQESGDPGKKVIKPKPFVLKTIRAKTKHLIRYIEKNLDGTSEPWEHYLADLFDQLQKREKKKESEETSDDVHAREKMT
jgi:hypothetical protein